jgi:hypothetical protein
MLVPWLWDKVRGDQVCFAVKVAGQVICWCCERDASRAGVKDDCHLRELPAGGCSKKRQILSGGRIQVLVGNSVLTRAKQVNFHIVFPIVLRSLRIVALLLLLFLPLRGHPI